MLVLKKRLPRVLMVAVLAALVTGTLALAQGAPVIVRLGLLAAADSPAGRGTQLAIAEINGSGGMFGPDGAIYAFELLSVPVFTADEVRAGLAALQARDVTAILGPDGSQLVLGTFNDLRGLGLPILTPATGDTITIADIDNTIIRTRAPEQVYAQAMAEYIRLNYPQPVVAIVQADLTGTSAESVVGFTAALGNRGIFPQATMQVPDSSALAGVVTSLNNLSPDVIGIWGQPDSAVELLAALRSAGWTGALFYHDAADLAFRVALLSSLASNQGSVLGVTNWVPGVRSGASDLFLRHYVTTFGSVPDSMSAAYYDAVYLLAAAINEAGGSPEAMRAALLALEGHVGVQGVFDPAQYFVGETINTAAIFELNSYAVPQVRGLFVDGAIVPNEGEAPPVLEPASTPGTPPPTAPQVTPTPTPTATPEGVWGTVNSFRLNVRSGPGMNYEVLGQFAVDDVLYPVGANADLTWLVVPFRGANAWVAAYLVDIHGNLNDLPIITPPPSPTPAPTETPTVLPFADLRPVTAIIDPLVPTSGQPFNVQVTIRNDGNVASLETAVAASFQPGEVYASATIPPLATGQSIVVMLRPTVSGSGTYTVELVVDLNNLVDEGPNGETNNLYPMTYTVDHAIITSGTYSLAAPLQEHDVMGSGTVILRWDGATLTALNGAAVAVLPGLNWSTLQYGQLNGITGMSIPRASLPPGAIVGLVTAPEGYRGALWINSYDGDTIRYSYRVYNP